MELILFEYISFKIQKYISLEILIHIGLGKDLSNCLIFDIIIKMAMIPFPLSVVSGGNIMAEKDIKAIRKEIEKIKKSIEEVEKRLDKITKVKTADEIFSGPVSEAP